MNLPFFYEHAHALKRGLWEGEECFHCIKVLRHGVSDTICLADGEGTLKRCVITEILSPDRCRLRVISSEKRQRSSHLHLLVAPPKSGNRLSFLVEKLSELGVEAIHLLTARYSVRQKVDRTRLDKVAISAMKQSENAFKTQIHAPLDFTSLLAKPWPPARYIAVARSSDSPTLPTTQEKTALLVGPEGGFASEERSLAQQKDFIPFSLSEHVLRTETAAILAAHRFLTSL